MNCQTPMGEASPNEGSGNAEKHKWKICQLHSMCVPFYAMLLYGGPYRSRWHF